MVDTGGQVSRPIEEGGRGTTDQLFTPARILEGAWEFHFLYPFLLFTTLPVGISTFAGAG